MFKINLDNKIDNKDLLTEVEIKFNNDKKAKVTDIDIGLITATDD